MKKHCTEEKGMLRQGEVACSIWHDLGLANQSSKTLRTEQEKTTHPLEMILIVFNW